MSRIEPTLFSKRLLRPNPEVFGHKMDTSQKRKEMDRKCRKKNVKKVQWSFPKCKKQRPSMRLSSNNDLHVSAHAYRKMNRKE